MKRLFLIMPLLAFVSCREQSDFYTAHNLVIPAFAVSLGDDVRATRGQEVALFGHFSIPSSRLRRARLVNPITNDVTETAYSPTTRAGYAVEKTYRFVIPENESLDNQAFELVLEAEDVEGHVVSDKMVLTVVPRQKIGEQAGYSWDLLFYAEYEQPANNIPVAPVLDLSRAKQIMRPLFPGWNESDIPYPILLQPKTSVTIGTENLPVECGFPQGGGYCVAVEDFWRADSDADYDMWFGIAPSSELLIYVDAISHMGAKNRVDIELKNVDSKYSKVSLEIQRRRRGSNDAWSSYEKRTETLSRPAHKITIWQDQKALLNKNNSLYYSARFYLRFQ